MGKLEEVIKKKHGKKATKFFRELFEAQVPKKIKYKDWRDLLKAHRSSRERYLFYPNFYEWLLKYSKFEHVIDLACGFNPFSIFFLKKERYPETYVAVDYYNKILEILEKEKEMFEKNGIKFIVRKIELVFELEKLEEFLKENKKWIILFLKTITIFSRVRKDYFEFFFNFLRNYKDNIEYIVISASKFSLSGKREIPACEKVEKNLKTLDFVKIVSTFDIPNEKFWLLKLD